jgi:hypothetical protein
MAEKSPLFVVQLDNEEDNANSVCVGPRLGDVSKMENRIDFVIYPTHRLKKVTVPMTRRQYEKERKAIASRIREQCKAHNAAFDSLDAATKAALTAGPLKPEGLSEPGARLAKLLATGSHFHGHTQNLLEALSVLTGDDMKTAVAHVQQNA